MRISIWLTIVVAFIAVVAVVVVGQTLLQPNVPLITEAGFSLDRITPNADGDSDVTEFSYSLSRNAKVSLMLEDSKGAKYYFRRDEPRIPNTYQVLFSGVVDGYTLPGEKIEGEVKQRLIPD